MKNDTWLDAGPTDRLKKKNLSQIIAGKTSIALIFKNGEFSAVSGECNHEGGPLGKGRMEGDYVVCPWHGWHFHRKTGHGKPPFEKACLPRHEVKEEGGRLFIKLRPMNRRVEFPHPPHPLSREIRRAKGPIRVVGISTTALDKNMPRYSTSEDLLNVALKHARSNLKLETKLIKLRELNFKHCGGFYSIDENACIWPCTLTETYEKDQMNEIYEALVFWADVVLIATPIRWGNASSLYYKMAERLNCVENQLLVSGEDIIKNKVAGFIITGGQDNVQAVAGQMMTFFGQIGFQFPKYPFIGHSRGWSAEDMDNNIKHVKSSGELKEESRGLVERAVETARLLVG